MRGRQFNWQIFLESFGFVSAGAVLLWLSLSRRYLNYVAPRMAPYLIGCALIFVLLGFSQLRGLMRPAYRQSGGRLFLLLIPALMLVLPTRPITSSSAQGGAFNAVLPGGQLTGAAGAAGAAGRAAEERITETLPAGDGRLQLDPSIQATGSDHTAATSVSPNAQDIPPELSAFLEAQKTHPDNPNHPSKVAERGLVTTTAPSLQARFTQETMAGGPAGGDAFISTAMTGRPQTLHGYDGDNRHITISDQSFYPWMCELFLNHSRFEGFTVSVNAQVYKNPKITGDGQFLASRLLMSCCAADLVPTGIICLYPDAEAMPNDRWVQIEGVLTLMDYQDRQVPAIQVTSLSEGREPLELYVYPYFR